MAPINQTPSRRRSPKTATRRQKLPEGLKGKVALITGGSRGIGKAIAAQLASRGCTVVIAGRDESELNSTAADLSSRGAKILSRHCDVRNPESVGRLFVALQTKFKRLDILVNNAGVGGPSAPIEKLTLEAWNEVIDTNLTGTFLITRSAIPMLHRGAIVINNLSVGSKQVFPGMAAYVASKHGARGFTDALREELRPKGIRVMSLMPGATNTDIWDQFWPDAPKSRMMSPDTIARAVVSAIELPDNASVDEIVITPTAGAV